MSLILDALNKSDHEQEKPGDVPDLHARHYPIEEDVGDRKRLLYLIAIIGLALMVVILLALLVWYRPGPPPLDPVSPAAVPVTADQPLPAQPATLAAGSTVSPPEEAAESPPEAAQSEKDARFGRQMLTPLEESVVISPPADDDVLALYQVQVDPEPIPIREPAVKTVTPDRQTVDRDEVQQLWREMNEQQRRPVALPPGVEIEKLPDRPVAAKAQTRPAVPPGVSAEESVQGHIDVPFLHELPENFQNTIPTLMYARHAYEQGFVIINKKRYHEGDTMQGNILLENLLADGILLRFNDRTFKLGAESSWVNY